MLTQSQKVSLLVYLMSHFFDLFIFITTEEADQPQVDNPALTTALKAVSSLTKEQKAALSRTLEGFVSCLAPSPTDPHPNPHARTVISEAAWDNRANWGRDEWNAWEIWGWYRQFCRAVGLSFYSSLKCLAKNNLSCSMHLIYAPTQRLYTPSHSRSSIKRRIQLQICLR